MWTHSGSEGIPRLGLGVRSADVGAVDIIRPAATVSRTGSESGTAPSAYGRRGSEEEPVLTPGAPLEDDDAGVVLQLTGLMLQDAAHQLAEHLRWGVPGGLGPDDEVGEALLTEEHTVG